MVLLYRITETKHLLLCVPISTREQPGHFALALPPLNFSKPQYPQPSLFPTNVADQHMIDLSGSFERYWLFKQLKKKCGIEDDIHTSKRTEPETEQGGGSYDIPL